MLASRLIWLLVIGVDEASLLNDEAMAKIKKDAGFNPKEPLKHNTDIKVGLYLEHLDVSASPHHSQHTFSTPLAHS